MDKDSYLKKFGLNLRKLRDSKKLTQNELAFNADMDRSYLSDIERGVKNPTLYNIYRLSLALNIPTSKLFNFDIGLLDNGTKSN